MKICIIGAGLIGVERIKAINAININHNELNLEICGVIDNNNEVLNNIRNNFNLQTYNNIEDIYDLMPEWLFICTPHHEVVSIIEKAYSKNYNIFVEKPLGRNLKEAEYIIKYKPPNVKLYVGFNYRFYEGIYNLITDLKNEEFGKIISVNMILGHGNAPNMEKSWKLDLIKCGGGCLIDPGIHLLDLVLQICTGPITINNVSSWSGFWNTKIEEECHVSLVDSQNTIFNIQTSLTRWRSNFRFEVNGTDGYGVVEGRGRSYGQQTYRKGKRWGWINSSSQELSETNINCLDADSKSFYLETLCLLSGNIFHKSKKVSFPILSNSEQALKVMQLLNNCQNFLPNRDSLTTKGIKNL